MSRTVVWICTAVGGLLWLVTGETYWFGIGLFVGIGLYFIFG